MQNLSLNFVVVAGGKAFPSTRPSNVVASPNDSIYQLKAAIQAICKPALDGIAIAGVSIYKVQLDAEHTKNLIAFLWSGKRINIKTFASEPLSEFDDLGSVFPCHLNVKELHLIIDCTTAIPNTAVDGEALPKQRLSDEHRVSILKAQYGYTPDLGGEGGTTYPILSWKNDIFEGIEIKEENHYISRSQTVQKLLDRLQRAKFLIVQAPPMTGKTSLALLTERHLRKTHDENDLRIVRISGAWLDQSLGFDALFRKVMGNTSWSEFVEESLIIKTVFILDEAQAFYSSDGTLAGCRRGGQIFWENVKQIQQGDLLTVIAFAAYGYGVAYGHPNTRLVSPFKLMYENVWTLENLRYTQPEYDEYFAKFFAADFSICAPMEDLALAKKYLWSLTLGHPGMIAFIFRSVRERFSTRLRAGESLPFNEIFDHLESKAFYSKIKTNARASGTLANLTEEEMKICDAVLRSDGGISLSTLEGTHMASDSRRLSKIFLLSETPATDAQGDLVMDNPKIDFSAPILRSVYMSKRFGSRIHAEKGPEDLMTLIVNTFQGMDAKSLKESLGKGKHNRLLESTWQIEFLKSATLLLDEDTHLSVNVGAAFGSQGLLDFWVGGVKRWAIELLRDGDRLKEHEQRWDGLYKRITENATDWVVVDIRRPGLPVPKDRDDNTVTVECLDKWAGFRISRNGFQTVTVPFNSRQPVHNSSTLQR
ncbi:hypothetical protein BZG36_05369 [Bifiguratus adelaidae]|uniref:Uncharacterized protein n=1 Tax=Bifiguratus adelaidae TaxID=1938954 RepID=A0A261XTP9_9FUNG|nr:hypothetical protein BZG36_05369 [Bifiguratus adelaidae]